MADSKTAGNTGTAAEPPFSIGGKTTMGASGGNDFTQNNRGGAIDGGGRDFTKESRSQSEADKPGPGCPNTEDKAPGGIVPLLDKPANVGAYSGVKPPAPFKNLK